MTNKHIGSDFDDFLAQEGILTEVSELAKSRVKIKLTAEDMELLRKNNWEFVPYAPNEWGWFHFDSNGNTDGQQGDAQWNKIFD